MGVVYDEEGNEYPIDDEGQIYIPYSTGQTAAEEWFEEEKKKDIKKLKRTYASVVAIGATLCSAGVSLYKENKKKSVGEICKYLIANRLERT